MKRQNEMEEYLESLWRMKEQKEESIQALKTAIGEDVSDSIIDELSYNNLVIPTDDNKINLTKNGEDYARKIIRSHRIAEKLIFDVLGVEFETGACEFEHIINTEVVDSICTLLGHPRECPHGMPIPEGECCQRQTKTVESLVIPLTELPEGMSAQIAYVNCNNAQRLHKMNSLQFRQGTTIKLLQKKPTFVVNCEGADIALDSEVASDIYLWKEREQFGQAETNVIGPERFFRGKGWGKRWRKGLGLRRGKRS